MKILTLPDKHLRHPTRNVSKVDKKIKELVARMFEALEESTGVGLAAPQIGENLNVVVLGFEPDDKQREKLKLPAVPKMVLINPRIVSASKQVSVEKEGCLSVPETEIPVPRFQKIQIEYLDEDGRKRKFKARGFLARVIQHELDHLRGKTITDYSDK